MYGTNGPRQRRNTAQSEIVQPTCSRRRGSAHSDVVFMDVGVTPRRASREEVRYRDFPSRRYDDGRRATVAIMETESQSGASEVVQELKKENFDLKLRLYMQEKNSASNEGKVSEYEEQLGAILGKFEEQQRIFEVQARELAEAKHKEKLMLKRQRNLETECKLRDEKIQNLSMSLNQLSTSMTNISSPRHYAPARNTRSMYFPDSDEEMEDDDEDGVVARDSPQHTPQVSRVAPMRAHETSTPVQFHDEMRLMGNNNNNNNNNNRPGRSSYDSTSSDPTSRITKNYYNTTINNPARQRADGNVGVVKPNNARTTLTTELDVPTHPPGSQPAPAEQKKKKRKGLFNMLKLCSGKSSQHRPPTREDSMYHKRPTNVARVTTTAQQYNSLEPSGGNEI